MFMEVVRCTGSGIAPIRHCLSCDENDVQRAGQAKLKVLLVMPLWNGGFCKARVSELVEGDILGRREDGHQYFVVQHRDCPACARAEL
jgi:hypothetical protein